MIRVVERVVDQVRWKALESKNVSSSLWLAQDGTPIICMETAWKAQWYFQPLSDPKWLLHFLQGWDRLRPRLSGYWADSVHT